MEKKDIEKINALVKDWRWRIAKAGMTCKSFSLKAGVANSNLSLYINFKKRPRPVTVERVEKALRLLGV